ncbi:hypothetical protein [Paludisphaera rhizosphaerae]|uniref:hypothetical protein n=1 Tax=Paludisphaera rhizosphaerae TaxID=2711216 RepID=UPI0013E9EB1A|nr:hypothetical protein [Paludisphaera rhizosphaerae]
MFIIKFVSARRARPFLAVAALSVVALTAGCGDSAPTGTTVEMPSSFLEDARRSDAAYDAAAKSKGKRSSPEPTSPGAPGS